jgi:hypothetical protein
MVIGGMAGATTRHLDQNRCDGLQSGSRLKSWSHARAVMAATDYRQVSAAHMMRMKSTSGLTLSASTVLPLSPAVTIRGSALATVGKR